MRWIGIQFRRFQQLRLSLLLDKIRFGRIVGYINSNPIHSNTSVEARSTVSDLFNVFIQISEYSCNNFHFFIPRQIKKHVANCNLKVRIYEGVNKDYVLPNVLASFDVVIASFETLRAELNYASEVVYFRIVHTIILVFEIERF